MKTIASIATQGRPISAAKLWITAYYLYYSQDGDIWTPYSESGDSEHSEVSTEVCVAAFTYQTRHHRWPVIVNHGHKNRWKLREDSIASTSRRPWVRFRLSHNCDGHSQHVECNQCIEPNYCVAVIEHTKCVSPPDKSWRLPNEKTSSENCVKFVILCSNRWLK